MIISELSEQVLQKLYIIQKKLNAPNVDSALDKSLNMVHFIAETLDDPESKLLIERRGKYQELKGFS